jgi:hypothetical protein
VVSRLGVSSINLWAVTAERPFRFRPGRWGRLRGLALIPLNAFLRPLMRWYVEPLAGEQRKLNAAVLRLADELSEGLERLEKWNRDRIEQIDQLREQHDQRTLPASGKAADSADALARVDVSAHNAHGLQPTFDHVVSQVVSASQFSHPDFRRLQESIFRGPERIPRGHRKVWELVYVLRAAEQYGRIEPGRRAVGFGVGQEPLPAALAQAGLTVLATDLDVTEEASAAWPRARSTCPAYAPSRDPTSCRTTCWSDRSRPDSGHERDSGRPRPVRPRLVLLCARASRQPRRQGLSSLCARSTCPSPAACRYTRRSSS